MSRKLLEAIDAAGLEYILGVRMRRLKQAEAVLSRAGRCHEAAPNLQVKEVRLDGALRGLPQSRAG